MILRVFDRMRLGRIFESIGLPRLAYFRKPSLIDLSRLELISFVFEVRASVFVLNDDKVQIASCNIVSLYALMTLISCSEHACWT